MSGCLAWDRHHQSSADYIWALSLVRLVLVVCYLCAYLCACCIIININKSIHIYICVCVFIYTLPQTNICVENHCESRSCSFPPFPMGFSEMLQEVQSAISSYQVVGFSIMTPNQHSDTLVFPGPSHGFLSHPMDWHRRFPES